MDIKSSVGSHGTYNAKNEGGQSFTKTGVKKYRCKELQEGVGSVFSNKEDRDMPTSPEGLRLSPGRVSIVQNQGEGFYHKLKSFSLVMSLINDAMEAINTHSNEPVAKQDHPLISNIKDGINKGCFTPGKMYGVHFKIGNGDCKIFLQSRLTYSDIDETPHTTPQSTPITPIDNVFDIAFVAPSSPSTIVLEKEGLNDKRLYKNILEHFKSNQRSFTRKVFDFLIRVRSDLPADQKISNDATYRLLMGEQTMFVSQSLRLSADPSLYVEFQVPLTGRTEFVLNDILDKEKEYPATLKSFHKNNQHNKHLFQLSSIPLVRNMQQAAPEKNVFLGAYLGSGIAQKVSEHGIYPSVVMKFIPQPMSKAEATSAMNTLNTAQALFEKILEKTNHVSKGLMKVGLSKTEFFTFVDQRVFNDKNKEKATEMFQENLAKLGVLDLPIRTRTRARTSDSMSEAVVDLVNVSNNDQVNEEFTFNKDPLIACEDATDQHDGMVDKKTVGEEKKIVWVAGMQKKYHKNQMVEYIFHDANEDQNLKVSILKSILHTIDICGQFNKEMEADGGVVKGIIDGNFGNFVFDRESDQLFYLDIIPSNLSINGQLFPGNQFMMSWFPERRNFITKLSTDTHMAKLFFLVFLVNELRKKERMSAAYKQLDIEHKEHEKIYQSISDLVKEASKQLLNSNEFVTWCGNNFLGFLAGKINTQALQGEQKDQFVSQTKKCFDKYLNNEQQSRAGNHDFSHLTIENKLDLLRIFADTVTQSMIDVKKMLSQHPIRATQKDNLIVTGVESDSMLGNGEVEQLMLQMIKRPFRYFYVENSDHVFYDVVLNWLAYANQRSPLKGFNELKGNLQRLISDPSSSIFADEAQSKMSLPALQRLLYRSLEKKIDVLLVEPFSHNNKGIRAARYEWSKSSADDQTIRLHESIGMSDFYQLMSQLDSETMVLINHQKNQLYRIDNVNDYCWSALMLADNEKKQAVTFNSFLPVEYASSETENARMAFESIVRGLTKLYTSRIENTQQGADLPVCSDLDCLKKIVEWVPDNCAINQPSADGTTAAPQIKMALSSTSMFHYKPLFRGYVDMLQNELGQEQCSSRLYIIMRFPDSNEYVRWMLRVVSSKEDQRLPYMNFRGPFSLQDLKSDIEKSNDSGLDKIDFMFFSGGYGYSSGNFYMDKPGEAIAQSGYCEEFFNTIESQNSGEEIKNQISINSGYGGHSDDLTSMEIREQIFK